MYTYTGTVCKMLRGREEGYVRVQTDRQPGGGRGGGEGGGAVGVADSRSALNCRSLPLLYPCNFFLQIFWRMQFFMFQGSYEEGCTRQNADCPTHTGKYIFLMNT